MIYLVVTKHRYCVTSVTVYRVTQNMAAFRFNFGSDENAVNDSQLDSQEGDLMPEEAKEVPVPKHIINQSDFVDKIVINGTTLRYLNLKHVEETLKTSSAILDASSSNSDLVPAVYEGGLKIWECTVDLIEYLDELKINFQDKRVLELGCGAGLPGIYSLTHGGSVDFQDYNDEVLERFTIPNVFLNIQGQSTYNENRDLMCKKCHFFAGDWRLLTSFINPDNNPDELYDIILTSETIYKVDNYDKLLDFFEKHLQNPDGIVYVAAKTHYFGVGGGTRSFEECVRKRKDFKISVCKRFSEGLQREVLKIVWNK